MKKLNDFKSDIITILTVTRVPNWPDGGGWEVGDGARKGGGRGWGKEGSITVRIFH